MSLLLFALYDRISSFLEYLCFTLTVLAAFRLLLCLTSLLSSSGTKCELDLPLVRCRVLVRSRAYGKSMLVMQAYFRTLRTRGQCMQWLGSSSTNSIPASSVGRASDSYYTRVSENLLGVYLNVVGSSPTLGEIFLQDRKNRRVK